MNNVILLTIDALRIDVLGCYAETGLSPFIDSIQDKCIRFTRSHSVGPYTQASFPGILASSFCLENDRTPNLSPKATLISEPLKNAGIYTAAFHSNPYLSAYFGWNRGWNHFFDSMKEKVDQVNPYIKGNVINEKVDTWLSSHISAEGNRPFFLWVHYMDLHEPYAPAKRYVEKVDNSLNLSIDDYMSLFTEVILHRKTSDKKTVDLLKKSYASHIVEVDEYVQMFFDLLKKQNVLKDTIVIITSDHGDEFAEHGGLSHDGKMYGELVHVPLMIYDPTLEQGRICDHLVSGLDISPTILYLFGLPSHPNFAGKSILPLDEYVSDGCFGECIGKLQHRMKPTDKPAYFYRKEDVKIIYREDNDQWELYDLQTDPYELKNIIESSLLSGEMKKKLNAFINRYKEN